MAEDDEFDIITNPPYKFAREFVEKALEVVADGQKVAMFLKLTFLEGQARRELFRRCPPPDGVRKFCPARMWKKWPLHRQQRSGVLLDRVEKRA